MTNLSLVTKKEHLSVTKDKKEKLIGILNSTYSFGRTDVFLKDVPTRKNYVYKLNTLIRKIEREIKGFSIEEEFEIGNTFYFIKETFIIDKITDGIAELSCQIIEKKLIFTCSTQISQAM